MAYWTVDFMSRTGARYHIDIEGAPVGVITALTPSDNPVTIEEEGDDNLFVPIKTQSGSIEIVTDDYTLARDIIPNTGGTRAVTITRAMPGENTYNVFWRGFVQPKMLTYNLWKGKQKLKIPIECCLSALKYFDYTGSGSSNPTIGTIFRNVLTIPGHENIMRRLMLQYSGIICSQVYYDWFRYYVYDSVFLNEPMTLYDVLKAFCTFFDFTARQCMGYNEPDPMDQFIAADADTFAIFLSRNTDSKSFVDLLVANVVSDI